MITVSDGKCCFSVRKSISTSEWCAEHPFPDRNTQHPLNRNVVSSFENYFGKRKHFYLFTKVQNTKHKINI